MKRIDYLDYAKALSIFFIVSIHVGFYQLNNIILFAMPLFFVATGYGFNPSKRTWKENVALRFKTILLPFWFFMLIYAIIEMLRAPLFGYGSWNILFPSLANLLYGSGVIPIENGATAYLKEIMSYKAQTDTGVDVILASNCHLWFLPAMFTGYVIFTAVAKQTTNHPWLKAVSIIVLLLFASVEVMFPCLYQLPYGIGRGAIGAAFMLVGFQLRSSKALEKKSPSFHAVTCCISALLYIASICLGSDGSVLVRSYYGPYGAVSVLITFIGGTAGAWLILELCRGIEKLPLAKAKHFLSFTGQNVITVYSLHMAVKFLFDAIYIVVLHNGDSGLLDEYKMGLLPEKSFLYMIFEVIMIIAVCLFAARQRKRH